MEIPKKINIDTNNAPDISKLIKFWKETTKEERLIFLNAMKKPLEKLLKENNYDINVIDYLADLDG